MIPQQYIEIPARNVREKIQAGGAAKLGDRCFCQNGRGNSPVRPKERNGPTAIGGRLGSDNYTVMNGLTRGKHGIF